MKKHLWLAVLLSFATGSFAQSTSEKIAEPFQTNSEKKINLNKADVPMLINSIKGVGKKRAESIIHYRENHQGFKTLEQLAEVKGFGKKFYQIHQEEIQKSFYVK